MAVRLDGHKQGIDLRMATGVKQKEIEETRDRYKDKKSIQIKNPHTEKWEWVKIISIHKHFMVIQTKHYQTSIAWRDILTGYTKVREG